MEGLIIKKDSEERKLSTQRIVRNLLQQKLRSDASAPGKMYGVGVH